MRVKIDKFFLFNFKYFFINKTTLQNVQLKNNGQDLMDCLIEKKNDPLMKLHLKCRASVEHQQLISLKDYHFTFKFKVKIKVAKVKGVFSFI